MAKIGTAAATNIAVTYAIGSRAQKLCKMREASLKQWPELMRSAVMINPAQLTDWATKSARTAVDQAFDMMRGWRERMTQLAPAADVLPLSETTAATPKRRRATAPVAATRKAAAQRKPAKKAAATKVASKRAASRSAAR